MAGVWPLNTSHQPLTTSHLLLDRGKTAPYTFRQMQRGTASALTMIRVSRGAPAPSQDEVRAAIERDRALQKLDGGQYFADVSVSGPYSITVDGKELDEYVVWER